LAFVFGVLFFIFPKSVLSGAISAANSSLLYVLPTYANRNSKALFKKEISKSPSSPLSKNTIHFWTSLLKYPKLQYETRKKKKKNES
jgi:hypothetical protein